MFVFCRLPTILSNAVDAKNLKDLNQELTVAVCLVLPGFIAPQVLDSMFNPSPSATTATAASSSSNATSNASKDFPNMHSYDAIKADIWACGAILHYLLLHCLPYGYSDFAHLLPMRDSLLTLWQLERKSWRVAVDKKEARQLKKISPEAQELLDQLLNPDEDARITLQAVKSHPWMQRRLPAMYERALQNMDSQQQQLVQQRGCMAEDGKLLAKAVQQMFEVASSKQALAALARQGPGAELVLDLDYGDSMVSLRGKGECRKRIRPAVDAVQQQVRELLALTGEVPEPSGTSCASTGWAPDPSDLATTSTNSAAVSSSATGLPAEEESVVGEGGEPSAKEELEQQLQEQQDLGLQEELCEGSTKQQEQQQLMGQLQTQAADYEPRKGVDPALVLTCYACGSSTDLAAAAAAPVAAAAKPQAIPAGRVAAAAAADDLADCPPTPKMEAEAASLWSAVSSV